MTPEGEGLLGDSVAFSLQSLDASVQRGLGLEEFAVLSATIVTGGQIVLAVQGYDVESLHSGFTFLSFALLEHLYCIMVLWVCQHFLKTFFEKFF